MHPLQKPLLRLGLIFGIPVLLYALWTPGAPSSGGKFDQARNGLWLAHGWMADDAWFTAHQRSRTGYDAEASRLRLQKNLRGKRHRLRLPPSLPGHPRWTVARK